MAEGEIAVWLNEELYRGPPLLTNPDSNIEKILRILDPQEPAGTT